MIPKAINKKPTELDEEILLLSWEEHNTIDTSYLGNIDVCVKPGVPFTPLTSYFSYEPTTDVDGFYDTKLKGSQSSNGIQSKPMLLATNALIIPDIPYHKAKKEKIYDAEGKLTYETVWERTINNKPYQVPNLYNPFMQGSASKNFYGNRGLAPKINYNSLSSSSENSFILPALSEEEVNAMRNNSFNTSEVFHITRNFQTKEHFRSHMEYKKGNLKEFILMTLGPSVKMDQDGNEIVIEAKDNLIRVPIYKDPMFHMAGIDPKSEVGKAHISKSIYILPDFIKEMNRIISSQTIQSKYTAQEQKEFEEFIAKKRNKIK
jgi:hypothetical protein